MSNEELLKTCQAHTSRAAGLVDKLELETKADSPVLASDAQEPLDHLWRELQLAVGAALELRNRAFGLMPPNRG